MGKLILEALGSIQRFLDRRKESKARQTKKHRTAVESVLKAVRNTEAYLYDFRKSEKKDRPRELELSELWGDAAADIRAVDARLSKIARLASFGWANPDFWEQPNFKDVPEQLDLLRKQCEWLLKQWD